MYRNACLSAAVSLLSAGLLLAPNPSSALSLEDAFRAGLSHSLALGASRNSWAAARDNIDGAQSTKEWRADGTVSGTQALTNAATAARDGFLASQSASATVNLSRNLYDGGQSSENTLLRTLQRDIAEARYLGVEQQVILGTAEAYLNVIRAQREVELNEANVARLAEHVAAAKARLDAGASTQTQMAQAEARLSRARTTLISAISAHNSAEDAFFTLTGMAAIDLERDLTFGTVPATLLEADDLARHYHPDVKLADLSVAASGQEFKALLASLRPTVAFKLQANESMAEGNRSDKTELSANVTLSAPLLPSGSVRAKARSLSSSLEATKLERLNALRQISLNLRNRFRELDSAEAQQDAVEAELAASRLVAEGITTEFQFGQKTTLDVLDAEQDVSDAELRAVNARHAILLAGFRLQAAMGQLTAGALGMGDQLGPLDTMPVRDVKYKSYLPLEVDWDAYDQQDGAVDDTSSEKDTPAGNDSSAAKNVVPEPEIIQPAEVVSSDIVSPESAAPKIAVGEVVQVSAAQPVAQPVTRPVTTLAVNAPETLVIPLETLDTTTVDTGAEGIVWQIQTRNIP